jgi:hypothetical protein
VSFRDFGANNMAHESGHESDENFEQSLENEIARASNDEPNAKAVGNVFADQFTALAEHLQQGFSSLEMTMTQAMRTKRKRKSSSSSSGSGSSNHSEQEATSIKEPKQAKKSTTDGLTEQVEDLLNTQEGNKSATSNAINTTQMKC